MYKFEEYLKQLRKEIGLTQKQLAELINTTDDSIYSWEHGRSQPSIEMLRKICMTLKIRADELLGLDYD